MKINIESKYDIGDVIGYHRNPLIKNGLMIYGEIRSVKVNYDNVHNRKGTITYGITTGDSFHEVEEESIVLVLCPRT